LQNKSRNSSRTGAEACSRTGSGTSAETGPQTVPESGSPRNQAENDCVAEDIFVL